MLTLLAGIAGVMLLYYGAEFLVKGGSSIALKLKISPLVIGLTLVAYATSAPELTVSIDAALKGMSDISLGNVIGSNICNIALIIGLCAIITPLKVNKKLLQFDIWVMIIAALMLAIAFLLFNGINRIAAAIMLVCAISYTLWSVYASRREAAAADTPQPGKVYNLYIAAAMTIGGLAALVAGAKLFVYSATSLAKHLAIPDAVIGLTVVAVGTSLPELATSVVAAIRKEQDIAIGNVIGSNIFNVLVILGVTPLIKPLCSMNISVVDIILMLFLSLILYPFMRSGMQISRREGVVLLAIYVMYTVYLIIK